MRLALFFTKGGSLKLWEEIGHLDREIKPYQKLNDYFEEIVFLTYGGKDELKYEKLLGRGIKILPNRLKLPPLLYSFLAPFLYAKELRKVDVFKTNQVLGSWTAVLAKVLFKKKLVVRQGRQWSLFAEKEVKKWKMPFIRFLEKTAYKKADLIIAPSWKDKRFIEKIYDIPSIKIKYIPNYIDTDLFKPIDIKKENRICCVAKLEEQKNLFNLIKAVSSLKEKLIIFGSGSLKEKLERFSKELKADVEFRQNIRNNDLPIELNKSKLFVLVSFYEGCPKALLEAMSCAMSVIATDVEGTKEIIKHKENGYLCEVGSKSIRKAISEVLKDVNLQRYIAQNARKTILDGFSLDKDLKAEISLYKNL